MTEGNDKTTPSYPQCVDSRPVDRPGWEALVRTADEKFPARPQNETRQQGCLESKKQRQNSGSSRYGFRQSTQETWPIAVHSGASFLPTDQTQAMPGRTIPDRTKPATIRWPSDSPAEDTSVTPPAHDLFKPRLFRSPRSPQQIAAKSVPDWRQSRADHASTSCNVADLRTGSGCVRRIAAVETRRWFLGRRCRSSITGKTPHVCTCSCRRTRHRSRQRHRLLAAPSAGWRCPPRSSRSPCCHRVWPQAQYEIETGHAYGEIETLPHHGGRRCHPLHEQQHGGTLREPGEHGARAGVSLRRASGDLSGGGPPNLRWCGRRFAAFEHWSLRRCVLRMDAAGSRRFGPPMDRSAVRYRPADPRRALRRRLGPLPAGGANGHRSTRLQQGKRRSRKRSHHRDHHRRRRRHTASHPRAS